MTADKREQRSAHEVQVTILPMVVSFLALEFSIAGWSLVC
jgi:hypothetical protein